MKQGRRLTRKQKELLTKRKLNPDNWFRTKDLPGELHIIHKMSNKTRVIKVS